jgi:hypothetical protein
MTDPKVSPRLAGHGLRWEGRWYDIASGRTFNGPGYARCSCGTRSPDLPSTTARKRWHREHKDAVRAGAP